MRSTWKTSSVNWMCGARRYGMGDGPWECGGDSAPIPLLYSRTRERTASLITASHWPCHQPGARQEHGPAASVVVYAAEPTHAVLLDHAARDAAGVLQVVGRAVGHFAVDHLLRQRTAQRHLDLTLQLGARHQVTILLRTAEDV